MRSRRRCGAGVRSLLGVVVVAATNALGDPVSQVAIQGTWQCRRTATVPCMQLVAIATCYDAAWPACSLHLTIMSSARAAGLASSIAQAHS